MTLQVRFVVKMIQSEKRDSNPRPRPWQGRALPTELFSHINRLKRFSETISMNSKHLSEKRDSNPRPRPWQGRALPTELFSHYFRFTNAVVPRLVPRFVVCVAKVGIIFELASVLEENFHKKCFQSRFGGFLGLTKVFYLVISEVNPYLCGVGSWQQ